MLDDYKHRNIPGSKNKGRELLDGRVGAPVKKDSSTANE